MSTDNNSINSIISTLAIPLASLLLEVFGYASKAIIASITVDIKLSYLFSTIGLIISWLLACGITIPISIVFLLSDNNEQGKITNSIVIVIQSGINLSAARRFYDENNQVIGADRIEDNASVERINEVIANTEEPPGPSGTS